MRVAKTVIGATHQAVRPGGETRLRVQTGTGLTAVYLTNASSGR